MNRKCSISISTLFSTSILGFLVFDVFLDKIVSTFYNPTLFRLSEDQVLCFFLATSKKYSKRLKMCGFEAFCSCFTFFRLSLEHFECLT